MQRNYTLFFFPELCSFYAYMFLLILNNNAMLLLLLQPPLSLPQPPPPTLTAAPTTTTLLLPLHLLLLVLQYNVINITNNMFITASIHISTLSSVVLTEF
jgi:hypothetical protein